MYIIETTKLEKRYRSAHALQGIDLALEPGHIYGLVGNNGAGKTTLFRILAGLITPTAGSYALFGERTASGRNRARRRAGFLIENAVYYPSMNASSNLRYVQRLQGGGDKARIAEVLTQVGLDPDNRQLLLNYSMGMKQRYGIAAALISDPELLVLDEPLNGLDPRGARQINALLQSLSEQGKTILLSSHLLPELYKSATDFIFMDQGKVIQQISRRELQRRCDFCLTVHTQQPEQAAAILQEQLTGLGEIDCHDSRLIMPYCTQSPGAILRALKAAKIDATAETRGINLEDYFLQLLEEVAQ